jgi:hypothetical protein
MNHETNELRLIVENTESYSQNLEAIMVKYKRGVLCEIALQNLFSYV